MRKIDQGVIDNYYSIKSRMSENMFNAFLMRDISKYEITKNFLQEFKDNINIQYMSSLNLNPECIKYLDSLGKFDYAAWIKSIKDKANEFPDRNIDILIDDEFCFKYSCNIDEILKSVKVISEAIYKKYFNFSDITKKEIILKYNGNDLTNEVLLANAYVLGKDILTCKKIVNEIKLNNKTFIDMIFNCSSQMSVSLLLQLLFLAYIPNEFLAHAANITLDSNESLLCSGEDIITSYLNKIVLTYPEQATEELFTLLNYSFNKELMNSCFKNIFLSMLVLNDNISEMFLINMSSLFIMQGLKSEFVNYCKNKNYANALIGIKLE